MKKVISVLLAVLMSVLAFAGCSKENNESDTNIKITMDSHYQSLDESAVSAYKKLCNAVLNCENEVKFNKQLLDEVTQLFYTSFPLNALVESIELKSDSTGVDIKYKNDADTHKSLISQFDDRLEELLTACEYKSADSNRFVFNAYSYLAKNFTIDNSVLTVYDAVMSSKGTAATINSVFEYLILCYGGEASHIINTNGKGAMISLIKFNSSYYYFDVGSEIADTGGEALRYFAMDNARINKYAAGDFSYTDSTAVDSINDDKYLALWNSVSYIYDDSANQVNVNCKELGEFIVEFE